MGSRKKKIIVLVTIGTAACLSVTGLIYFGNPIERPPEETVREGKLDEQRIADIVEHNKHPTYEDLDHVVALSDKELYQNNVDDNDRVVTMAGSDRQLKATSSPEGTKLSEAKIAGKEESQEIVVATGNSKHEGDGPSGGAPNSGAVSVVPVYWSGGSSVSTYDSVMSYVGASNGHVSSVENPSHGTSSDKTDVGDNNSGVYYIAKGTQEIGHEGEAWMEPALPEFPLDQVPIVVAKGTQEPGHEGEAWVQPALPYSDWTPEKESSSNK